MSISDQLAEQYRAKAKEVEPPAGQRRAYRELFERENGKKLRPTRRRPILIIAVALFAMAIIAGFNRYAWVHFGDGRVRVEYRQTTGEALSSEHSSQIHQRLVSIQAQLGNGESAIVYLPEIDRVYPEVNGMELLLVSNPAATTDYEAWEKTLLGRDDKVKRLPNGLLGFDFVKGQQAGYFGGAVSPDALKLLPEMKSESEAHGGTDAWRRVDETAVDPFPTLTTIYRNKAQDEIFVSTQWFNQKGRYRGVTGATELEKVNVGGTTVQYRLEEPFFYTGTNRFQSLQWVETFEDRSLVYTLGTPSLTLTKEDLIAVMKELQTR